MLKCTMWQHWCCKRWSTCCPGDPQPQSLSIVWLQFLCQSSTPYGLFAQKLRKSSIVHPQGCSTCHRRLQGNRGSPRLLPQPLKIKAKHHIYHKLICVLRQPNIFYSIFRITSIVLSFTNTIASNKLSYLSPCKFILFGKTKNEQI